AARIGRQTRTASLPRRGLGVAFDVRAQLGDRAAPQRSIRKLGFDRSVGVERIGHALDDARLQDRCRRWLLRRRRLRRWILDGYCLIRLRLDVLDFWPSLGLYAANP